MNATKRLAAPLRVLMVSPFPRAGLANGGVASAVETLAVELSAHSDIEAIQIVSLQRDIVRHETSALNEKLSVHYLPGQRRGVKVTRACWDYLRVKQVVRNFRPTVVHGHGVVAEGDIATRLGLPSVVTVHGMPHLEAIWGKMSPVTGRIQVLLIKQLVERVLERARIVISISHYDQRVLAPLIRGVVFRIPNGVRRCFFAAEDVRPARNRILFAGSIIPLKNVVGIIRAFARVQAAVPEACLDLAGLAPDERYFREIMTEVRTQAVGSVTYLGNLATEDVASAMKRAAVVVLFSHQENLPCIIAEAMAASRAVVSSNVGGVPEMIVHGHTGLLVNVGDEESLAAGLIRLLKDPALTSAMGARGNALARERWFPTRIANQTISAYRAALDL